MLSPRRTQIQPVLVARAATVARVTRLILVRHGESNATVSRMIGGWRSCTGLSPLGHQQAEHLRDRWLANPEFQADVLISSQYARARETATILAPALGDLPIVEHVGFGEHDPGPDCDGLSFAEYVSLHGSATEAWDQADPFATTFPGGETVAAFNLRVGTAMYEVVREHEGKTVVIACHGGVVGLALRLALKAQPMGGFETWTLNTSITELLLLKPNHWRVVRYNDAAHLAGLPEGTLLSMADLDPDE